MEFTLYKETKFKETPIGKIPENWKIVRLEDIAEDIYYGITAKAVENKTELKMLRTTDIKDYNVDWDKLPFCEITEKRGDIQRFLLKKGDLIIARAGTTGVSVLVEKDFENVIFGSYLIKVSLSKGVHPKFMHYFCQSRLYWNHITSSQAGSTLMNISLPILKSLNIPLPSLTEQQNIAEILSTVDDAIQKTNEIIAKTERLKKGLMHELLTKGIGHKEFKNTEIGRIPKDWEVVRLEEICEKIKAGGTPLTTKKEFWNGNIPFVKIEDITSSGKYLMQTLSSITNTGLENSNAWLVPERSLLLAMYGSLGEVSINIISVATNQAILGIIPKEKDDLEFLYYWFLYFKPYWRKFAKPTTQANLTAEIVRNTMIPLPSTQERRKIAEILSTVDHKLEAERKEKAKLERIKQGLMDLLLTGKVRIRLYTYINSMSERNLVVEPIIEWLKELGWRHVKAKDLARGNEEDKEEEEVLLIDEVKDAIKRINKDIEFDDEDLDYAIRKLRGIPSTLEGIKQFLYYFRHGISMPIKKERKERVVRIVDNDNIDNNSFIVVDEFSISTQKGKIRLDIVLFVNGIPLVLIEAKRIEVSSTNTITKSYYDAYKDIKYYESICKELFKYVQISIACDNENIYYFPNYYAEEHEQLLEWKDPYPYDKSMFNDDRLKILIYGMLKRENLIDIITNFTFVTAKGKKVTCRYMQFRAVNKIYKRVIDRLTGKDDKRYGLIWHWQGSGKTYTMAFASLKLLNSKYTNDPSIFIIVDRISLEDQLEEEFKSLNIIIRKVNSIRELKEIVTQGREGERGVFLSTIEKFRPKEFKELEQELKEEITNNDYTNTTNADKRIEIKRKNVIVFADEAHRSHYGIFSTMLRSIFSNAFFFGFTGTPLSKSERNTFQKFSEEGELYLDRYSMLDSLNDNVTIPISYQARLPNYHLNQDELDILARYEEEIEEELSEQEKKQLKSKVRVLRTIILRDERVRRIAEDIREHFTEVVEPTGLKAMVVAYDRLGCVKYKRCLDELLGEDYSMVVMSYTSKKKEKEIRKFVEEMSEKYKAIYGTTDPKVVNDKIKDDFKYKDKPKILIVTDMLITGFDAPNLWAMYIDKPLREHKLLQTIARTNRPYSSKHYGLIVDYIGILDDLEKSLKVYEADDLNMLRSVVRKLDEYAEQFKEKLYNVLELFNDVKRDYNSSDSSRSSINKALDILMDPDKASKFEEEVKRLMRYYEMLKGEALVRDYLQDYKWIISVYTNYIARYKRGEGIDYAKIEEISKKTRKLIEESIEEGVNGIQEYPTIQIDENFLNELKAKNKDDIGTAVDIYADIIREIKRNNNNNSIPFFLKLREEVENAYEELRRRRENIPHYIERARDYCNRIIEWKKEEEKLGSRVHRIYEYISNNVMPIDKDIIVKFANDLIKKLEEEEGLLFKGWNEKDTTRRKVRREIRLLLLERFKDTDKIKDKIDDMLDAIFKALVDTS
jgi:type I restriction enzyme R subunit